MRYLKTYKIFEAKTSGLTKEQAEWLDKCTKGTWKYNPVTGLVDVDGNFYCEKQGLSDFKGVRFGKVGGNFRCDNNQLTTLEGAPQEVGGYFSCDKNQLTSLEGAPQKVDGSFHCDKNQLTSLEGAPQEVGAMFYCFNNQLTTLEGAPRKVGKDFDCDNNQLTSLVGAPQKIGGSFECDAFKLERGEWNLEGLLKIFQKGSKKAQDLILKFLPPEALNQEIQKDPAGMIMKLKEIWNDESFKEIRGQLVFPKGYEKEADLLGDLDDVGF